MSSEELLDEIETKPKRKTPKYGNWSFRFFIYAFSLNIVIYLKMMNFSGFGVNESTVIFLGIVSYLILALILSGLVFSILAFQKKEKRSYKLIIGTIGHSLLIGLVGYNIVMYLPI